MFGIGPMELIVVAVCALVFVGPQKLPDLMKQLGRFFVQARRYSSDIRGEFNEVVRKAEAEIRLEEAEKMRAKIAEEIEKAKEEVGGNILEAEHHEHSRDHDDHHGEDHHHDEDYCDEYNSNAENQHVESNPKNHQTNEEKRKEARNVATEALPLDDSPEGSHAHNPAPQKPIKDPFGDDNL